MQFDLWVLAIVGVFALLGGFSGAMRQLAQWGALALAYALGKPAAEALGWGMLPVPPLAAPVVCRVLVMLAIYLASSFVLRGVLRRLLPAVGLGTPDRLAGVAMGGAKAAFVVWILLSVVVAFDKPLAKSGWDLDKKAPGSRAIEFTRRHSLAEAVHWPILEGAKKLAAAQSDPNAAAALMKSPAFKAALEDPQLKAALSDPALQDALKTMDPSTLMNDPRIKKLLGDPELAKKLGAIGE